MDRVKNKVALVTGAAQGLGAAIAAKLAAEGATVIATDINTDTLKATVAAIGEPTTGLGHDVTSDADWQRVLDTIDAQHGRLDILVNNAGIAVMGNIVDETPERWRQVHAIDLDSVFIGCRAALPLLEQSGAASIVNVSSISGVVAGHNTAAYNSAKAAVTHLSKSIALHCARAANGVRCNSIHPAFVDTPILDSLASSVPRDAVVDKLARQIPLGRIGSPDDVAWAVLYLASDESAFVTGTELRIDGGLSAS
ncbi:MAG: glucose 1-dehydrogenase [Pseudomonadota bacterium]